MFLLRLFAKLPLKILYPFSDVLYFLLRYVIKYRSEVILHNLTLAFPEKSRSELVAIRNSFYKNFTDFLVENLKMLSDNPEFVLKRYDLDVPFYKDFYKQNKSLLLLSGHQFNWEWGGWSLPLLTDFQILAFYLPLSNEKFDALMKEIREKQGTIAVSAKNFRGVIRKMREKPSICVMIADQSPANLETAYYVNFFGKETPFLSGAEKLARLLNVPVVFTEILKLRRGKYQVKTRLLAENPRKLPEGKLTELFAKTLEESIRKHPENYLWSHRRWKHAR